MQKPNFPQLAICAFSFFFLCGLSDLKLGDIQAAIMDQEYATAQRLAQEFIAGQPDKKQLLEAQYYLGLSQVNQENYAEARAAFQQVLDAQPSRNIRDRAILGIVDCSMLSGSFEDALHRSQKLLQESPQSEFLSLIYFKIARAQYKLTRWDDATQTLKTLLERFPDSPEAHLAKQLMSEKHYFAVQVGSFMDQELAERMAQDLRAKDKYAYIVETVDKSGQKFYRVRIGQFSRLDQALSMAKKISQLGYPTLIYP